MTTLSDMTGLQVLQHALQNDTHRGIGHTMEFALVELEEGRVVFEGQPTEKVYNPIGTVHGGYAATLLDSACGCAVHSTLDAGQGYSTAELKVAYHRAMTKDTGPVRAEGKVVTKGRRLAFAEARLTDAAGTLYASATSTLILL
ncbi:PaaI family thioesterase [Alloalcanivorax sp. C16-1]|uniref:PaaI family thioesterase n=1 Tax=Alloalcanivorax sp. C16-1 TaxID=3390051 RepID=UPI003970BC98